MVEIGDAVTFVDALGKHHDALVTTTFNGPGIDFPSVNLVYVSDDPQATDQYGRQLAERKTSVVHQSKQAAHGYYWE